MTGIRALLNSAIDYAGLFPPASLSMRDAVLNYARYRAEASRWALGRFIVPASRLPEFQDHMPNQDWSLSVLLGSDLTADLESIQRFQRGTSASIDSVEGKIESEPGMDQILHLFSGVPIYLEIPFDKDPDECIEEIAKKGMRAKVRTGGVKSELFPTTAQVARFLVCCARRGILFKATAGLHHAFRSVHPLTYESASASEMMHGFVNVLLGSAAAFLGLKEETVNRILEEQDRNAFDFKESGAAWKNVRFSSTQLMEMRECFFVSFGSCSFEEPLTEMINLGLL